MTFAPVCGYLRVWHLTKTANHPHNHGQVNRFNKTIVTRLCHCVAEYQTDWDQFFHSSSYAYNAQVHCSTGTTPFTLVLSPPLRDPAVSDLPFSIPTDMSAPPEHSSFRDRIWRKLATLWTRTDRTLETPQAPYTRYFDKTDRVTPKFLPGQYIFVDRPPEQLATALISHTSCARSSSPKPSERSE